MNIFWFIGQPGSGKSTLARLLKLHCNIHRIPAIHLDGDALRVIFGNSYSKENFTKEYRIEQTKILQKFVDHIADQSIKVIISTVNPYRDVREEFKQSRFDIQEIYVETKDFRGREHLWVKDFEPPLKNFISVVTDKNISSDETFNLLCKKLVL